MKHKRKFKFKQWIFLFIIIILVVLAIIAITVYFNYRDSHPKTDDAIVDTAFINVAAQVEGNVSEVFVKNHQMVKKGQVLFKINPKPYQLELDAAKAKLKLVEQKLKASHQAVQSAQNELDRSEIELKFLEEQTRKILALVKSGGLPKIDGLQASSKLAAAKKAYLAALNSLNEAKIQASYDQTYVPELAAAKSDYKLAEYRLHHTVYTAPITGTISNFTLHVGDLVTPGRPLFAIVENNDIVIRANFPETHLAKIHKYQKATVSLKAYPDVEFSGYVEAVGSSSNSSFSLLPAQNATGNFVSITARFPVVIQLTSSNVKQFKLRKGMSATVVVNTIKQKKS